MGFRGSRDGGSVEERERAAAAEGVLARAEPLKKKKTHQPVGQVVLEITRLDLLVDRLALGVNEVGGRVVEAKGSLALFADCVVAVRREHAVLAEQEKATAGGGVVAPQLDEI
jgi:hypothetical protein